MKTIIEFNLAINSVNTWLGATPYKVWRLLTRRTRNGRDGGATKINYGKLWIIIININMIAYQLLLISRRDAPVEFTSEIPFPGKR